MKVALFVAAQESEFGPKRTRSPQSAMSALRGKADVGRAVFNVAF